MGSPASKLWEWGFEFIRRGLGWDQNQPIQGGASSQPPTTQTFSPVVHDQGTANMAGRDITNNDYRSPNQKSTSVNNTVGNIEVSGKNNRAKGNVVNIGKPPSS